MWIEAQRENALPGEGVIVTTRTFKGSPRGEVAHDMVEIPHCLGKVK